MYERDRKLYLVFTILLLLTLMAGNSNLFIRVGNSFPAAKIEKDTLYQEIKRKAPIYDEAPENASIDRVWKKTPGRNGKKVNITASYQKMKSKEQFKEDLLVFEEEPPEISLKDLPPSPIFRGHPDKQMVALMINVSWGEAHIPDILEILKEANVKATFFIDGKWATTHKDLVRMIDEQGHLIGNHAYNHPDMAKLPPVQMKEQMTKTNDILEAITDKHPHYFAPPSGSYNHTVVQVAHQLHMETMLWTVDTIDWQNPSVSVMMKRVHTNIHPGATVLMHPTTPVREGLGQMIEQLKESGYELGTLETLMDEKR